MVRVWVQPPFYLAADWVKLRYLQYCIQQQRENHSNWKRNKNQKKKEKEFISISFYLPHSPHSVRKLKMDISSFFPFGFWLCKNQQAKNEGKTKEKDIRWRKNWRSDFYFQFPWSQWNDNNNLVLKKKKNRKKKMVFALVKLENTRNLTKSNHITAMNTYTWYFLFRDIEWE